MAGMQSRLERAIYDIKCGANVSQLHEEYNISTRKRIIKEVKLPEMTIPTDDVFFSKTEKGKPDVEFLKDHFYCQGRIKEEHALYIIDKATQLLRVEQNVLTLVSTVNFPQAITVCGNIYGQYYDLLKLFEVGGHPSVMRYLFLGDYINGGYFSMECLLYLWTLKIWYPNSFFLLRGRNECRRLTEHFTFEIECKHKYSKRVYEACLESFCALPLAAIMNTQPVYKQLLCISGGISPELHTIDDIRKLNRFREPPTSGLMCDILWSDPIENFGQERTTENFVHNHVRGYSYFYTYKAVCDFLECNRLFSIIRAHEVRNCGYRLHRLNHKAGYPSVITLFSAPSYPDVRRNQGAVLTYDRRTQFFRQFNLMPHPYRLPGFRDAFSWSIPFICEKVLDMLAAMLYIDFSGLNKNIEIEMLSMIPVDRDKAEHLEMLQNKILAVRCISHMFSLLREETEHESELRIFLRSSSLIYSVLSLCAEDIKNAIKLFNITPRILRRRTSDKDNERLPPVERQPTPAFLSLSNTKGSVSEKAATATAILLATPMTAFRKTKEGGESGAKKPNTEVQDSEAEVHSSEEEASKEVVYRPEKAYLSSEHFEASIRHAEASPTMPMPNESLIIPEMSRQQDKQSDTPRHQTDPQTNRATQEVHDVEGQLRERERYLQIREADVQDVQKVLRVKERDLQIREADIQKMLQTVNERREAMDLQEDDLRQRSAAMKEWEENLRLREVALTQQMAIAWQPNGATRESDLFSLSSISTIRNTPHIRSNFDLSPGSNAKLKQDAWYHGNESVSPASTARDGPSKHTNIGLSSSKSLARLKEDSEYYGNE